MRCNKFELITGADFFTSSGLVCHCRLLIQPIHRPEQTAKLCVVNRESGQPFANWFALPPSGIANRREMITIQPRANITGRRGGKWIVGKEREGAAIVVQEFPDKMQCPWIVSRRGHRSEPDLPIDPRLIRRNERWSPVGTARFGCEFVFLPFSVAIDQSVIGSFENNFVSPLTDAAERSVSIDQIERVERGIHYLPIGNKVEHWRDAQICD